MMVDQRQLLSDVKRGSWVIVATLVAGLVAVVFIAIATHEPPSAVEKAREQAEKQGTSHLGFSPQPPPPASRQITMAHYLKVREGMTYKEVSDVIGFQGVEDLSAASGGHTIKVYTWPNGDGTAFIGSFSNGRLDAKTQVGLR